jgi:DNA methylase
MVADAIKDVSRRGGIVLDPFAGSGSTLIASHKTGRRARLCEIDPVYCDRILQRWETFAKDDVELVACGLSGRPSADALSSADELQAAAERQHTGSRRLRRGRHFGG